MGGEIQLTVTAKDADDNTVTSDSITPLIWLLAEGDDDPVELGLGETARELVGRI